MTLDANVVKSAVCPTSKGRLDLYDTAISGFILEVRPSGNKTYYLRYRDPHGKQRQYKIGDAQSLSFEQAKQAAQTLRAKVVLGENPSVDKAELKKMPTLAEFAYERYLPYVKGYKRSWQKDESILKLHIIPRFGRLHLDEITTRDVSLFHLSLPSKGYAPGTANCILVLLRYMFNLARKWDFDLKNPATGISKLEENNIQQRYLNPEETQRLYGCLQESGNTQLKYIVPLLLLTGCRKRELLDAQWAHVDIERRTWRIPLSKSGKARHVPLSLGVLAILAQLPRFEGCPYLVPNPETRRPYISIFAPWNRVRKQAGLPEVRMHDLRHSFASFLINSGRSLYEVQHLLGHAQSITTQRYAHLSQSTLLDAVDAVNDLAGI
jgi:integrase